MKESLYKTIQKLRIDPDKYQTDLLNELELHRKNLENSRRMSVIIASTFKLFNRKKLEYTYGVALEEENPL